ncbi:hypothetical protein A5886_001743 [Enterococcus sp. 8G7_MSG3316]|uniref:Uncharacterized protein n=1 Tax=Candidatus Enterococcus testudinis TaxID=1834191 RepID=A0A242A6K2_9ENTE|nr:hypothetical protein [Enterococcus sp. 8G7_MSG3316]OTN76665.1 hypothetical protein A5886_001743 [Enterococcus sp. 8G7_MSG3316]
MKRINVLIFKKRFYLFAILCLSSFFMNLFLWNETTQLIRAQPVMNRLKHLSANNIYLINYVPDADGNGAIKELSDQDRADIASFLLTFQQYLYSGTARYLHENNFDTSSLTVISKSDIERNVKDLYVDIAFMNNMFLLEPPSDIRTKFEDHSISIKGTFTQQSMSDRYQNEYKYYFGNFLFGLSVSGVLLSFGLLIIYLLVSSSVAIFSEELRLLRMIGLPRIKIRRNIEWLFAMPILFSAIVFIIFINNIGFDMIIEDYIYITFLNMLLCFISKFMVDRKLKKGVYDD